MISAAYEYLSEELSVLPLKADKSPALPVGHNLLYERAKESDIEQLFMGSKKIGIACGNVSNGFECIDFDAHDGEDIRTIFNDYMKDDGIFTIVETNNLPIIKTMGGGYHLYYKSNIIEGSRKLARWTNGNTMIETRGEGAYVATIPSEGYTLLKGSELIKIATITDEERDYLLSVAENFTQQKITPIDSGSGKWQSKFDTSTAWGKFNETGEDEAKDILNSIGWEFVRTRKHDNVEMWLRPGKEYKNPNSKPVSATYGKLHNMFYLFTDNAEPLKSRVGYTHFDILMLLKFDGDKIATIKYLEKKYNIIHYKSVVNKKTIDFPLTVFPDKIISYIKEQNKVGNFDVNLMGSTFIWLASSLIGNRFSTFVNDTWNVSPVTWLMIIAERGSTKTHAINAIISPAKKIDSASRKDFEKELKDYKAIPDNKSKHPVWKQIFLEDGTREGFTKAMINNSQGLGLMKDELTGWVSDMDRHSSGKGGDEAFWLSSFNNSSYTKNIKSEDDVTHVTRMFLNLAGSIQPGVINDMVKNHSVNGLFDRFLLVPYKEKEFIFSMKKADISYFKWYNDFIKFIHSSLSAFSDLSFNFDESASNEFARCYNVFLQTKYKDSDPAISAYIAKIITYLPRLTLVIEIIDQIYNVYENDQEYLETTIRKNSVTKAFDVLLYFLNNARNVLFDLGEVADMNDIIKASGSIKKADKVKALLAAMETKEINIKQADIARFVGISKQRVSTIFKSLSTGVKK